MKKVFFIIAMMICASMAFGQNTTGSTTPSDVNNNSPAAVYLYVKAPIPAHSNDITLTVRWYDNGRLAQQNTTDSYRVEGNMIVFETLSCPSVTNSLNLWVEYQLCGYNTIAYPPLLGDSGCGIHNITTYGSNLTAQWTCTGALFISCPISYTPPEPY